MALRAFPPRLLIIFALPAAAMAPAGAGNDGKLDAVAVAPPAASHASFKAWEATCRNDGYCSAKATDTQGTNTMPDFTLHIGRPARQTYWEIGFKPTAAIADLGEPFTVTVSDRNFDFKSPAGVGAYGAPNDYYFFGKDAQRVFETMAKGTRLMINFTADEGSLYSSGFSLEGLGPALLWIDEQQHRIGSQRVAKTPPFGLPRVTMQSVHASHTGGIRALPHQ